MKWGAEGKAEQARTSEKHGTLVRVQNDLATIAFDAGTRALDKQERVLEELRSRTGVLLAVSSLAAAFLGRPALDGSRDVLA